MARVPTAAVFALLIAGGPAIAEPDIEGGREVAVGLRGDAPPCATCHGSDGAGDRSGAFPRLDGQGAWYLYKQLRDYASGLREDQTMSPIARQLSEQEMEDVAAYYAEQSAQQSSPPQVDPMTLQQGGAISAAGIPEDGVPACDTCHGEAGAGMPPVYPYLAGQYAPYTVLQMQLFRDGQRTNDPLGVMQEVAEAMDDEEIEAVAAYLEAAAAEEDAASRTSP